MPSFFLKIKEFFRKFFLIDDSPHKVAAGAAMGIFLGIFPGEGVLSTVVISSLFRFNRLAAMAGVLATNMWTTLVFLPFSAMMGATLFRKDYVGLLAEYKENWHLGIAYFIGKAVFLDLTLPLLVGFFVVSLLVAIIFYMLLYVLLLSEHRKKEHLFIHEKKKKAHKHNNYL